MRRIDGQSASIRPLFIGSECLWLSFRTSFKGYGGASTNGSLKLGLEVEWGQDGSASLEWHVQDNTKDSGIGAAVRELQQVRFASLQHTQLEAELQNTTEEQGPQPKQCWSVLDWILVTLKWKFQGRQFGSSALQIHDNMFESWIGENYNATTANSIVNWFILIFSRCLCQYRFPRFLC